VRKRAVGARQIEGVVHQGDKVVLIDDMMAAGTSKLNFVKALRAAGAQVDDLLVLFDYGTFGADSLLSKTALKAHALATWHDIRAVALRRADFEPAALAELDDFLLDPGAWSQAHGGKGSTTTNPENQTS
jgi:orotate phosphoribosyltransferase